MRNRLMSKSLPKTLSVDDAVALLINQNDWPCDTSLFNMLSYFREEAEVNLGNAETDEEQKKYKRLLGIHINREDFANGLYKLINDEIDAIKNGRASKLIIDDSSFGSVKLNTASFCRWSAQMGVSPYGWETPDFSILAPEQSETSTDYVTTTSNIKDVSIDQLSPTKGDHLYMTFALLIDAFLENSTDNQLKHSDNRPNVKNISLKLEELATNANKGTILDGQSNEAIKKRIAQALKVKKQKLPQK